MGLGLLVLVYGFVFGFGYGNRCEYGNMKGYMQFFNIYNERQ